jgi:isopropylmalate/homocitrate/citramalate synthase
MLKLKSLLLSAFLLNFVAAAINDRTTIKGNLKDCVTARVKQRDFKTIINCPVDERHFNCKMPDSKREKKMKRNRKVEITALNQIWECKLQGTCEAASWKCQPK